MSRHPDRPTCRCGRGKVSAWDGKCGHCRSQRERKAVERLREGWPKKAAERGFLTAEDKTLLAFQDISTESPR